LFQFFKSIYTVLSSVRLLHSGIGIGLIELCTVEPLLPVPQSHHKPTINNLIRRPGSEVAMVTHCALKWSQGVTKSLTGQTVSCVGKPHSAGVLLLPIVRSYATPAVAIKLVFLTRSPVGFTTVMVRFFPTC